VTNDGLSLEREVPRRGGSEAHDRIIHIRERVQARTGIHPDPAPVIRELRDGLGRGG